MGGSKFDFRIHAATTDAGREACRRISSLAAAAAIAALLAGCAQAQGSDEPSALSRSLKIRTVAQPAPDFVARTRPPAGSLDYIPVHAARTPPAGEPMTSDQIRAKERELDAVRAREDRAVGRRSAKPAPRSVADGGMPKRKPPQPIRCVLTCPDPATTPVKPGTLNQPMYEEPASGL